MRNNSTIVLHFLIRLTVHLKSTQTLLVLDGRQERFKINEE